MDNLANKAREQMQSMGFSTEEDEQRREQIKKNRQEMIAKRGGPRSKEEKRAASAELTKTIAENVPVLGEAMLAKEIAGDVKDENYFSAGLNTLALGVGVVPGVGKVASKPIRAAAKAMRKDVKVKPTSVAGPYYDAPTYGDYHSRAAQVDQKKGLEKLKKLQGKNADFDLIQETISESRIGNTRGQTAQADKVSFNPVEIKNVKGLMGEELYRSGDYTPPGRGSKLKLLKKNIKEKRYKPEPITIVVREDGAPFIAEGNHRLAEALESRRPKIDANIQYLRNAEKVDGPLNPKRLKNSKSDIDLLVRTSYEIKNNKSKFKKGGVVPMNEMARQMDMFDDGGLMDEGGTIDPVSGNDVPSGSTQKEVRDDIPAQLSEGEFVMPADVVRYHGLDKMMALRDEAKMGLARMEAMGQMGNSEEATIPDGVPFGIDDLEVEDDGLQMAQGGVVSMAPGGLVPLGTPVQSIFANTPQAPAPMQQTPATSYTPPTQQFTPLAPSMPVAPTFGSVISGPTGQTRKYVGPNGAIIMIPVNADGTLLYQPPPGYVLADDAPATSDPSQGQVDPCPPGFKLINGVCTPVSGSASGGGDDGGDSVPPKSPMDIKVDGIYATDEYKEINSLLDKRSGFEKFGDVVKGIVSNSLVANLLGIEGDTTTAEYERGKRTLAVDILSRFPDDTAKQKELMGEIANNLKSGMEREGKAPVSGGYVRNPDGTIKRGPDGEFLETGKGISTTVDATPTQGKRSGESDAQFEARMEREERGIFDDAAVVTPTQVGSAKVDTARVASTRTGAGSLPKASLTATDATGKPFLDNLVKQAQDFNKPRAEQNKAARSILDIVSGRTAATPAMQKEAEKALVEISNNPAAFSLEDIPDELQAGQEMTSGRTSGRGRSPGALGGRAKTSDFTIPDELQAGQEMTSGGRRSTSDLVASAARSSTRDRSKPSAQETITAEGRRGSRYNAQYEADIKAGKYDEAFASREQFSRDVAREIQKSERAEINAAKNEGRSHNLGSRPAGSGEVSDSRGNVVRSSDGSAVTSISRGGSAKGRAIAAEREQRNADNATDTRVICTELYKQGKLSKELYRMDVVYTARYLPETLVRGYHYWAIPTVPIIRKNKLMCNIFQYLTVKRAEEIAHIIDPVKYPKSTIAGKIVKNVGELICYGIGIFVKQKDYSVLYNGKSV